MKSISVAIQSTSSVRTVLFSTSLVQCKKVDIPSFSLQNG